MERTYIDIFPKTTDGQKADEKMLNFTHYQRNANQNHSEVIISHWSEWPSSKSLQTINAGEGVEKREFSYTVGRNANQQSHYGEQCGDSLKKTGNRTVL